MATALIPLWLRKLRGNPDELTYTFTGSWQFEPDDVDGSVMVADTDFLTFGIWLYKPVEGEDSAPLHRLPMVRGSGDDGMANLYTLNYGTASGMATFRGNAAGKYATRNLTAGTADVGLFHRPRPADGEFRGRHARR